LSGLKIKTLFGGKWLICLIAILISLAVAGCGGSSTSTTSGSQPAEQKASEEAKPATYKLNQEVKVGNLSYIASEVKKAQTIGNEFLNKKTEGLFVIVKVKITNNDKESRTIDTNLFKAKDAQGREFSADPEADMYVNGDNSFFLEQVNPGTSRSGYVIFETPKDVKGLTMEVSSGLGWSGGEYASIDLGI